MNMIMFSILFGCIIFVQSYLVNAKTSRVSFSFRTPRLFSSLEGQLAYRRKHEAHMDLFYNALTWKLFSFSLAKEMKYLMFFEE